jgi:hypothetical protein
MNNLLGKLVAVAAWVLLGVALSTSSGSAQGANDVVGTWTLVSSIQQPEQSTISSGAQAGGRERAD